MIGLGYDACRVCDHEDYINCERCTSTQRKRIMEAKRMTGDSIDDSSFLTSALVGAATDSALLGGLVGGDLLGGMIGDSFFGSDD